MATPGVSDTSSPWSSPVLFAPKKDSAGRTVGWRFCVDFSGLNKVTQRDHYPSPNAEDLIQRVGGAQWFSKIDLRAAFWQIRLEPSAIPLTGFTCEAGEFEWLTLPFGLANSPASFQRLISETLADCIQPNLDDDEEAAFASAYLDDVLVYSHSADDHLRHLRKVSDRLQRAGLKLHPGKCEFFITEVPFLGHLISGTARTPPQTTAASAPGWASAASTASISASLQRPRPPSRPCSSATPPSCGAQTSSSPSSA